MAVQSHIINSSSFFQLISSSSFTTFDSNLKAHGKVNVVSFHMSQTYASGVNMQRILTPD